METPSSDKTDSNPNPLPSSLRTNSTKRPAFGSQGKSLSFEDRICTVIPNDSLFMRNEPDPEDEDEGQSKCFGNLERSKWWNPDSERNWTQFCMNTSIHGLKYVAESQRHIYERLFWLLAFCISVILTTYLINSVWLKYSESPVVITFQPFETFVEQVPFPAITICNMNKVLKSKAEEYMRAAMGPENDSKTISAYRDVYYLDHVCSTSNKPFSTIFNYTSTQGTVPPHILQLATSKIKNSDKDVEDVAEFLQRASQPCSDMLKLCLWGGDIYNCSDLFRPIETNFGKCCTFNMVPQTLLHRYMDDARDNPKDIDDWKSWNLRKDGLIIEGLKDAKKFPRRQNRAGKVSGLAFLVLPDLEEYFCTSSDSTGFRLATHMSTDVPHVTDFGIAIRPNSEHFVSVRPEVTIADDIIERIPIPKRNCYMDGEYKLSYYKYYTAWNCFDECIANLTYEECSCVRYYMPRDQKRAICPPSKFECAESVKRKSFSSGVKNICQNCLPTCTEIKYFAEVSATPFRRRVDLWADEFNKSTSWGKSNISIIHVYFGQESSYARVRSQLYGLTDLIANFGGLMGLCMGFSGLSLVELIYFFTIRVWYREKRKRRVKKKQELRQAADRDRENMLAYLGVGLTSSRRGSMDSTRSNTINSISNKPISIITRDKDVDSGYGSNSPTKKRTKDEDVVVAVSKF